MHKIAFSIPFYWHGAWTSIPIHWYGILVATGFFLGLWTASRRAPHDGIPSEKILDAGPWLILGGLIGARLLFVISYWQDFFAGKPWTEILMIRNGGLVFYGGLIGATASTLAFVALKKVPAWKLGDALAPSIALGHCFGRIGCLMFGCCYGKETHLPWAIHFPVGHETYPHGVHPTEIYEALLNLGLYLGLAWMYRRKKFDGQIFAIYLVFYAVIRAFVEVFRGDLEVHYAGWITQGQLLSLPIFVGGLVLLLVLHRRQTAPQPA